MRISRAGACTITPTSGCAVLTCTSSDGRAGAWPPQRRHLVGGHHPRADAEQQQRAGSPTPPGAAASAGSGAPAAARAARRRAAGGRMLQLAGGECSPPFGRRARASEAKLAGRARAARRCRWPAAAGRARPSRACSGARDRPAGRRRRPGCPPALASRQVTPPVECTSTSAAASSSGILSVNPYTRTRGSSAKAPRSFSASWSLRPARHTMLLTSGTRMNSRTAPAMSPTPQPPPETTTDATLLRQSERAAGLQRGSGAAGTRPRSADAPAARFPARRCARPSGIDSPYITRCDVDARLRPEEQARQIGDRGDRRAAHRSGAAQSREHDGDGGVGRDDHVGIVLGDGAPERARPEQAQQPAGDHAERA